MKPVIGVLASLTTLFSLGCGKSDSENFADSFCAEVAKCCGQASMAPDGKVCHQWAAFAQAGGSYNAAVGNACLAEMKAEVSAGTFCSSLSSSSSANSACESVYGTSSKTGDKKPGETCDFTDDCALSSEGKVACASEYVDPNFIYKCQVQVPGKVGDTCAGTQDGDLFYATSSATATDVAPRIVVCNTSDGIQCKSDICTVLGALGSSCGSTRDCVRSAFCTSAGKCSVRVAAGSPCASGDDDECLDGNYCASGTKQCTAKGENGAACTTTNMCQSSNCPSGTCESNGLDTFGLQLLCG